jgi:hypothetical protein
VKAPELLCYTLFQIYTFSNHTYTNITGHLFIETTNDAFCSQIYKSNSLVHDLKSQITLALRSIQYQYAMSTPVNRQKSIIHSTPWSRVLFEQLIGPQLVTIKCRHYFSVFQFYFMTHQKTVVTQNRVITMI